MQAAKQIERQIGRQVKHWITSWAGPAVTGSTGSRLIAISFTGLTSVAMLATPLVALPLVAVLATPNSALALALDNWQFDTTTEQLMITVPKGVTPRYHLMAEPARIVLDLPNAEVGPVPMQQSYSGAVRQIRVAQFQPDLARIVLELSPNAVLTPDQVALEPIQDSETATTQRWALRPLLASTNTPSPAANSGALPPEAAVTVPETESEMTSEVASGAKPNALGSNRSDLPPVEPGAVEVVGEASASIEPATTSSAPAQIASAQVETQPTQFAPPVIEFSMPLPTDATNDLTDPELTEATGTAAALSTDARSAQATAERTASRAATSIGPSAGTLSFPTPTADAIQVPSVSTVNVANPTSENSTGSVESSADQAHLTSKPAIPASVLPFGQPFPSPVPLMARSEVSPEAQSPQPETQLETQPETRSPASGSTARRSTRSAAQQPARPQPTQPAVTQPDATQPAAQPAPQPSPSTIEVIPFGQPLPR